MGPEHSGSPPSTELLDRAAPDLQRFRRFHLNVVDGPDSGRTLESSADRAVVGTHETADLRLDDRSVSRFHCEIAIAEQGALLRDLHSTNGTLIGGLPVLLAPLADGATITVGRNRVLFRFAGEDVEVGLAHDERFELLVGRTPAMRRVFAQLQAVAATDATVLILGETGTGKEVAAESLHRASPRASGPFVIVDCASIPSSLLESELFGHERGSFTGALAARQGAVESASGGTLFLDEVGELGPELQPKLLRLLERREVKRVGSDKWSAVDVRVVAATNRDLREQVNQRLFRADLYYRLAVVVVTLPPLRARREDLPLLVDALLRRLGRDGSREAELVRSPDFLAELTRHQWSGNVRELRNYLEMCLTLQSAPSPGEAHGAGEGSGALEEGIQASEPFLAARDRWVEIFERRYLTQLLERTKGNVSAAAREAGLDRTYLYKLLARHGLR